MPSRWAVRVHLGDERVDAAADAARASSDGDVVGRGQQQRQQRLPLGEPLAGPHRRRSTRPAAAARSVSATSAAVTTNAGPSAPSRSGSARSTR